MSQRKKPTQCPAEELVWEARCRDGDALHLSVNRLLALPAGEGIRGHLIVRIYRPRLTPMRRTP